MLRGAEDLMKICQRKINERQFHRNADGTLSWEEVECQGACVNAPMVMIGRDAYEDLTPERLEEIIDAFEAGKGDTITPGPQIDRVFAAPVTGLTSLLDDVKPASGKRAKASAKAGGKASKPAGTSGAATRTGARKVSSTAEIAKTASAVRPKSKPPAKTVEGGNSTMKLAATASGRAKPPAKSAKAATTKGAATDAGKTGVDDKNRPPVIDKPAQPDDLKLISGVGPKLEGTLHSLGIYTFAQVAKWKKAEREWVDGYLKFKGRIDRDDWVKQAKVLAKGGVDEYVRVFGKKPR
jgi:NADH-quinone oxidoreductase subunit E